MNQGTLRSSLIAVAIAIVVWIAMGLIFLDSRSTVALWAVIIAIGTFVITYGISTVIGRAKR